MFASDWYGVAVGMQTLKYARLRSHIIMSASDWYGVAVRMQTGILHLRHVTPLQRSFCFAALRGPQA